MRVSATALVGALLLAGSALLALPASAQEQVDMRSTLAGGPGQAYRQADRGYTAPAPADPSYRAVTAHGRYGMRYSVGPSAYAGGGYGDYARGPVYADGRSDPQLTYRDQSSYEYGHDDHQAYGGGPLSGTRRAGSGYPDGGDPGYAPQYVDGGGERDEGYDRRYVSRDYGGGYGDQYADEPYGYRGGIGYAGPYGYGDSYAEEEHYRYADHIDRWSGFVAPPPHDSREARELRDACGCDDEDDGGY